MGPKALRFFFGHPILTDWPLFSLISAPGAFKIRIEYLPLFRAILLLFIYLNFLFILCFQLSVKRRGALIRGRALIRENTAIVISQSEPEVDSLSPPISAYDCRFWFEALLTIPRKIFINLTHSNLQENKFFIYQNKYVFISNYHRHDRSKRDKIVDTKYQE